MKRNSFLTALTICMGMGLTALPLWAKAAPTGKTVLATTFPIYQIVRNVTQNRDGIKVELMLPSQLGCPHDYALTPQDMQKLAKADFLITNGLGMEEFLGAPLKRAHSEITVIDSSLGIKETLQYSGETDHEHGHHNERPFEWAGAFELNPGVYRWSFAKVEGKYADPAMKMVYLASNPENPIEQVEKKVLKMFAQNGQDLKNGNRLRSGEMHLLHFDDNRSTTEFEIKIEKAGTYVFFTEHMPSEFEARDHFFKTMAGQDVEPVAQEPGHTHAHQHDGDHHEHGQDHHHAGVNPHLFTSPRMSARLAMNIAAGLSKADPNGAAIYFKNARAYSETMNTLADDMSALGKRLKNNQIVEPHGIFDYLARDMGLEVVAVMQAHGQEPSAAEMIQLAKTIKEKGAGAIFTEPQYPEKTGKALSKETGIAVAMLDPAASGPEDAPLAYYETVMRQNMKTLESTLGVK